MLNNFVSRIKNKSKFSLDEMIYIAKRENNTRRDFLFVNKLLGKHYPVSPHKSFEMYEELFSLINKKLKNKKVLIVGFAETATALSQYIAARCTNLFPDLENPNFDLVYYTQTTRETLYFENEDKIINLNFKEEHSHATEQKLYLLKDLPEYDVVLFVEDEISTGKTILNFISEFEKISPNKEYIATSILNWQNRENKKLFKDNGIKTIALVTGELKKNTPLLSASSSQKYKILNKTYNNQNPKYIHSNDVRSGKTKEEFEVWVNNLLSNFNKDLVKNSDVVLGTEEFMFVPMYIATKFGKPNVKTHSTTRSPILLNEALDSRLELQSSYDENRTVFLYNYDFYKKYLLFTDVEPTKQFKSNELVLGNIEISHLINSRELVKTSYNKNDVIVLLQKEKENIPVLNTKEREKLNQRGVHYSEMLPIEETPSDEYLRLYKNYLEILSPKIADSIQYLAERIYKHKKGKNITLVSLARAGSPIGILVKRYLEKKYLITIPHYTVSIIRGKGLDNYALYLIANSHGSKSIQFIDGWVGKGAINKELEESVNYLKNTSDLFKHLDSNLAVLTDSAYITELYGSREDFLIPSSCLNATVSGLFSRTVKTKEMTNDELHCAVYYSNLEENDLSYEFINEIEQRFKYYKKIELKNEKSSYKGIDVVKSISYKFGIDDLNKIKPGVGETTRVLLRRVPDKILINKNAPMLYVNHITQLAKEKNVPIEFYPLHSYSCCGIIKSIADL